MEHKGENNESTRGGNIKTSSDHFDEDDIVISGIAGRFPDSDNMRHFQENLFNKVDLVTDDDRRWKLGKFMKIHYQLTIFETPKFAMTSFCLEQ